MTKKEYKALRKCFKKVVRVDDISKPEYQELIAKGGILCENDWEEKGARKVQSYLLAIENVRSKITLTDARGYIEQILFNYWSQGKMELSKKQEESKCGKE